MNAHALTGVVVLTPPGRGAVATVLVDGPRAAKLVADRFQPVREWRRGEEPAGMAVFGRWGGPHGEEVVMCQHRRDQVEVHCHGGSAAVGAIVESLVDAGCRPQPWVDWLSVREVDPIQVAARQALARTRTLPAAAVLLDQYSGSLRRGLHDTELAITNSDIGRAIAALERMLACADLGLHLEVPWRVVLAGPPNVGKSRLLNALLGYCRAIVCEQPGTTRDVVTATTALGGWPVELADTAGLRSSADTVEAAGVARAEQQIETADAVVLIFDASQPMTAADRCLQTAWPAAIRVQNKCDLARARALEDGTLCVSAVSGAGVRTLAAAIADRLVPSPPPTGAPVPFRGEHVEAIQAALDALVGGDCATAIERLRHLT